MIGHQLCVVVETRANFFWDIGPIVVDEDNTSSILQLFFISRFSQGFLIASRYDEVEGLRKMQLAVLYSVDTGENENPADKYICPVRV